jgi:hypothetical protein
METKDFITEANENGESFAKTAIELLAKVHTAQESGDNDAQDVASDRIYEYPLSVLVRSGWYSPGWGIDARSAVEYEILLSTGGPASRIIGDLDEYSMVTSARFEFQDWFKPWTPARNLSVEQDAAILEFAEQFYFGE